MHSLTFHHKLYSWIYFGILIVMVIFLYQDYGISWDEPVQWGIGNEVYEHVHFGDQTYLQMNDRIYGVAFEYPLVFLQKKLHLKDTRDIFFMRHLAQGLFFAFACFVFFRMNLRLFGSFKIAIIPTLILLLSPRIFAHAFFNSKDLPFLCMYVISFSALHRYLLKPNYIRLLILAFCAGLLINFRIMGLLFFATAITAIFIYLLQQRKLKFIIQIALFTLVASLILYATWPYLWNDPLVNLKNSFVKMSQFPWTGSMFFRGEVLQAGEKLPQYLFGWISVSVPIIYLVISGAGILIFIGKNIFQPKKILESPIKLMGWIFLINAVMPVAAVLYLHSILYDDWRQLYFIYPSIIIFSGYFIYFIHKWKPKMGTVTGALVLIYIFCIGFQMRKLHPFEHVYFNELVPRSKNYIQMHYEMDYWGTGFYDGLKYVARTDDSDTIKIFLFSDALRRNAMLLPEKDRNRFVFLQNENHEGHKMEVESKYYMTNFRYDHIDIVGTSNYGKIVYEINRHNSPIFRVWTH